MLRKKKKLTKTDTTKKAMLMALDKTLGIVSPACKKVGISRQTHYEWMREDPDYKAKVEDVDEMVLDFSETHLHKAIAKGNVVANIFHLKTKGKKRGYTEVQQIEHSGKIEGQTVYLTKAELDAQNIDDDIGYVDS